MPAAQPQRPRRPGGPGTDSPQELSRLNRAIHAKLNELKKAGTLDEAGYRDILRHEFGVSSSAEMDVRGRRRLLWRLKGGPPPRTFFLERLTYWRVTLGPSDRPGMATDRQLAAIDDLCARYVRHQRNFLFARFKVSDMRFLNLKTASNVIQALRRIEEEARRGRR